MTITDAELAEWERLANEATAGPWYFNGYSAIFSGPLSNEYDRIEREIEAKYGDGAPTSAFAALPETQCAYVPVVGGDTGTAQGMKDAAFIAAAREALPRLVAEVRRLRADPAPIVKVTECVGHHYGASPYLTTQDSADGWIDIAALLPNEACACEAGRHGRFRITVEFWPENAEEPPTP